MRFQQNIFILQYARQLAEFMKTQRLDDFKVSNITGKKNNYLIGIFMVYHWKSDIDTNIGIGILLGYIS